MLGETVEWAFEDSKRYPYTVDYNVGRDLGEYVKDLSSESWFLFSIS